MKKKMSMQADELEIGMYVHAPTWTDAPDRVGPIIEVERNDKYTTIKVDGAMKFLKRNDEYITAVIA
jgi:hypothetical protein